MSTTLPLFWSLSASSRKERLDASVKLISALDRFQRDWAKGDEESEEPFENSNAPDVAYSLKRLIRGLASPRESSRLGFAVALTEVRRFSGLRMNSELAPTATFPFAIGAILHNCFHGSGQCKTNWINDRQRRTGCPFRSAFWLYRNHSIRSLGQVHIRT